MRHCCLQVPDVVLQFVLVNLKESKETTVSPQHFTYFRVIYFVAGSQQDAFHDIRGETLDYLDENNKLRV